MSTYSRPAWFVGASWGSASDQTDHFIANGIWENGYTDRYLDRVREVEPGDRIAIKSAYTRKTGVPFDAHGRSVAVMAIKAVGVVTANQGDGRRLTVSWQPVVPPREWYFYTYMKTIWKVTPGEPMPDALLAFTFAGQPQNYELFLDHPFWAARYGGSRAWLVRPGADGQPLVDTWLDEEFVSLSAAHLRALGPGSTRDEVQAQVQEDYEHVEYPQRRALTEDYFAFLTTMSEGDAVVVRHDDHAWLGRVVGESAFFDDAPRLRRAVEWMPSEVPVKALPPEAQASPGTSRLIIDLTQACEAIEALFDEDERIPANTEATLPRATDDLAAELHMPTTWLDGYISLLGTRRQLIVYGPPGTGKTFVARRIAQHVAGEDRVSIVQFHPSYAYEDFFEGLRPVTLEGSVSYELSPGPLRRIAAAAAGDTGNPYVLILDEINRADIAKVFGELYYLLEYRGDRVTLQYSEQPFSLPKNLYVIGTMNTADRSIALVDAAIRRRFPFIEMHPSEEPVNSVLESFLSDPDNVGETPDRAALLHELNSQLTGKLREFQIGPSYLMRDEASTEAGLSRIWRYDILPLLEEQLYGTHTREQVQANFGLDAIRKAVARKKGQVPAVEGADDEPEA